MCNAILVLNAGSSSIKFAVFEYGDSDAIPRQPLFSGEIDGIGAGQAATRFKAHDATGKIITDQTLDGAPADIAGQHRHALDCLLGWLDAHDEIVTLCAVGHRVVHGAEKYAQPILLDATIRTDLAKLIPLAPLHQPYNLDAIRVIADLMPTLPQVACFDTAFHTTQPLLASQFALPRHITAMGVRRYGFHGLSYEYIATTLPEQLGVQAAEGRIIVAHLGNGASMCAMHERKSIATTMGFTALDGLMMGTRPGTLDCGVLLYLMDNLNMDSKALARLLYKESGLLGVSGISQDMRALLASPQAEAQEAVDLFCYRAMREIGSLAAALGGLDALVFTGGIGEHAAPIREKICAGARWLGVTLDTTANGAANAHDGGCISAPGADVKVLVMPTNEEWMIARHTARLTHLVG